MKAQINRISVRIQGTHLHGDIYWLGLCITSVNLPQVPKYKSRVSESLFRNPTQITNTNIDVVL